MRAGLGRPGGRDGGALAVSGDAYGVILRYMASLAGLGPPITADGVAPARSLSRSGRCRSIPAVCHRVAGKLRERRKVRALETWMTAGLGWDDSATAVRSAQLQR